MGDPGYTVEQRARDSDDYGRHWNTDRYRGEPKICQMCERMFNGPGLLCRRCREDNSFRITAI